MKAVAYVPPPPLGPDAHRDAAYWDRGPRNVPDMTGARDVLDAQDLRDVCGRLGLALPLKDVLDVGCGTGRLAQLCASPDDYAGCDIAPSAVSYCAAHGRRAYVIRGPADLPTTDVGIVTCVSVFTHMDRAERRDYLAAFARCAPEILADIIPGDGTGDVAYWTADEREFLVDIADAGYVMLAWTDQGWDHVFHRFFWARRAQ